MEGTRKKLGLAGKALDYFRDPAVAMWRKCIGTVAGLYALAPLDFIPDVVLVLGQKHAERRALVIAPMQIHPADIILSLG